MTTKLTTRTQELAKKDLAHLIHQIGTVGQALKVIWERGEGAKLWDTDGKQYIDMASGGVHCCSLGFNRKELNDAACEQMQKISQIFHAVPMSNVPTIEYAAELAEVLPGDINHVYLTNGGTDSNEVAVQIARLCQHLRGKKDSYRIISLANSYHGGSVFTRSLSGRYASPSVFGQAHPGIIHVPDFYCHNCTFGLEYPDCNMACARFVESVIEQEGEETIVAFIAEPVQGSAGVVWPPDEYWPMLRKICSDHNVLLIADCVQTGFCRTGKFWGVDNWNVVPDVMTMGKGINSACLPFGAIGVSDKVYTDLSGQEFVAASTTAGSAVCAATARAALKIYKEEKLAERAARLGEHIHERLVKEFLPLPCVDNIMGKGLFQSFEIVLNKTAGSKFNFEMAKKARETIFSERPEKGVLTSRYDGFPRRQPIAPPLIIGEGELDSALDVILNIMKEVRPV